MTKILGTDYIPNPIGASLTEAEKKQIAYTVYSRFHRAGNLPDWSSPLADDIRKGVIHGVNQVIDSLELNGYRIER